MRITNKIMQNNSLYNINQNKILQDKLNTQMSTQKTITRPSDDPVIAIRSLRLRSNLSEVTQYYKKNVPDARSWLDLTEDALDTVTDVLTDMRSQCVKGSNSDITTDDRLIILENLQSLRDEVYSVGNTDYAGRGIFTGYRTDMSLTFTKDTTQAYTIHEQLTNQSIDSMTYVSTGALTTLNSGNYNSISTTEYDVQASTIYRMRLAYDQIDSTGVNLQVATGVDVDGNTTYGPLTYGAAVTPTIQTVSLTNVPTPYDTVLADPDAAVFVPETGELLLGENVYEAMAALPSSQEVLVTYDKSEWENGDLNPVHYFACESGGVDYNHAKMTSSADSLSTLQIMEYDVGFNQTLRVNTTADECFTHNIGRDVDELLDLTNQLKDIDKLVTNLKAMIADSAYAADLTTLEGQLSAAEKAQTLVKDSVQSKFENCITEISGYSDQFNLAITQVGSRSARLELVENRLSSQQTNFQELYSDNDQADVTELAIQLSSAELSYEAALLATGKIVQTSLLNFL